jgi:hypothetical protein
MAREEPGLGFIVRHCPKSMSGSGGPTTAAISPPVSRLWPIGPAEAPGLALEVGAGLSLPNGVHNTGTGLCSPRKNMSVAMGISLSGSFTLGAVGHQLRPKILDTTHFLQRQMARQPYTPSHI